MICGPTSPVVWPDEPTRNPRGDPALTRLVTFGAGLAGLLLLVAMAANVEPIVFESRDHRSTPVSTEVVAGELAPPDDSTPSPDDPSEPREPMRLPDWIAWPVAGAMIAAGIWVVSRQRFKILFGRRRERSRPAPPRVDEGRQAAAIADAADELIGELELGDDPREAIRRAYAMVETGFGQRELARRAAEPPLKYLDRVFGRRPNAAAPLATLTDRFQLARFSTEPVTETMRSEAVDALRGIRDVYRSIRPRRQVSA